MIRSSRIRFAVVVMVSAGLAPAACSDGDEVIPIDAAISIDAAPLPDAATTDGPAIDAVEVDAAVQQACLTSVSAVTVTEGASVTVAVTLAAAPQGALAVTLVSADPTVATVAPASLNFTPGNFATPQIITITAPEDANMVGEATTVTCSAAAATPATVAVTAVDND